MYDPEDDELFEEGWLNGHEVCREHDDDLGTAFGLTGTMPRMRATMRKRKWSTGIRIEISCKKSRRVQSKN